MSHNYKSIQNEVQLSPSMTFREYYMSFISIKESQLTNGWGWFVDTELNSEPILIPTNNRYRSTQYVSIPKTIKEYPSIRSMKSMNNLHDTSMIFQMDEDINIVNNKNISSTFICVNTICIVLIAFIYYSVY